LLEFYALLLKNAKKFFNFLKLKHFFKMIRRQKT